MRTILHDIFYNYKIPSKARMFLCYSYIGVDIIDKVLITSINQLSVHLDNMYKFKKSMLEKATLSYNDKDYTIVIREYIDARLSQELFRRLTRQ